LADVQGAIGRARLRLWSPTRRSNSAWAFPGDAVRRRRARSAASLAADDGHSLNLDQQSRTRQPGHRDQRACRKALLENLLADLREAIAKAHIGDEHRHAAHVLHAG